MGKSATAHVVMVPIPLQGHVIIMLELAHVLASHRISITFVNTDHIHNRILSNSPSQHPDSSNISFVSVPDGLEAEERDDLEKFFGMLWRDMPHKIEVLIKELHQKATCLVYDQSLAQMQHVAERMGIQSAAFVPTPAAALVLPFNIPKLIQDGVIDDLGNPLTERTVQLAPTMPIMKPSQFAWLIIKSESMQKLIFDNMRQHMKSLASADWILCKSTYDLEEGAFTLAPNIVPIGPLLAGSQQGNSAGHFLKQDSSCLEWLDQHPPSSVVYVAFGSIATLSNNQFQELALGLERSNRPFVWVARPDGKQEYPDGFLERVSGRGLILGWAPQQKLLAHPSIACFISHCGWNSTVESLSSGVPMLCWPCFGDHFIIESYICHMWKVGLQFERDDRGEVSSQEFEKKIQLLIDDEELNQRVLQVKDKLESSAGEGGKTRKNLDNFINFIQEC